MCGACRVKVDGKTKFPCVRGPEFDAHPVNWDAMLLRMKQFLPVEDFSFDIRERDNWHRLISSKRWRLPNPESLTDKEEVEHKVACSSA